MTPVTITFRHVPGIRMSSMRAIGFLEGHGDLNAASTYEAFSRKIANSMNVRMQRWVDGHNKPKTWFHGFPNDKDHKECFVFKFQEHRLYGFLCNPKPKSSRGFRLCVLTRYDAKHEWETDESILPEVDLWRTNSVSRAAIAYAYAEYKQEGEIWKN